MRRILASLALSLTLVVAPALAHADIVTFSVDNTLDYPGAPTTSVGTVTGTFSYDTSTAKFLTVDLTYVEGSTTKTYTSFSEGTFQIGSGSDLLTYTILGSTDNTAATGSEDAYLEIKGLVNPTFCTLANECPGDNASNFFGGAAFPPPNVGAAIASTPEPSSLVLLGTGILSAAGAARRRFRKA